MPKIIPFKFIPAKSFRSDFKRFLEKKNDFKQKSFLQKIAWKSYDFSARNCDFTFFKSNLIRFGSL